MSNEDKFSKVLIPLSLDPQKFKILHGVLDRSSKVALALEETVGFSRKANNPEMSRLLENTLLAQLPIGVDFDPSSSNSRIDEFRKVLREYSGADGVSAVPEPSQLEQNVNSKNLKAGRREANDAAVLKKIELAISKGSSQAEAIRLHLQEAKGNSEESKIARLEGKLRARRRHLGE
jgi:hypothetical protein